MKIIKLPDEYDMDIYTKEKSLEECKSCPFCGEHQSTDYYLDNNINTDDGSLIGIDKHYTYRYGRIDKYEKFSLKKLLPQKYTTWVIVLCECNTCGARWQSDPYKKDELTPYFEQAKQKARNDKWSKWL